MPGTGHVRPTAKTAAPERERDFMGHGRCLAPVMSRPAGPVRWFGMAVQVAVIGSGREHEERAERVGRLLAERGATVVCGGLGEVMEAAARGAKSAGGTTIGIVPGESRHEANRSIDHVVVTGIGHGRNLAVVASGDAVIAVGGRWGTLAEIGFAKVLGRYVVILEPGWEIAELPRAATPDEAVELALAAVG